MPSLVKRLLKGSPLTIPEADANCTEIRRLYRYNEDSVVTTGTDDEYVITSINEPLVTNLTDNVLFGAVLHESNTTDNPTLQVDSSTRYPIKNSSGNDLNPGDLEGGTFYFFRWVDSSSEYRILNNPEEYPANNSSFIFGGNLGLTIRPEDGDVDLIASNSAFPTPFIVLPPKKSIGISCSISANITSRAGTDVPLQGHGVINVRLNGTPVGYSIRIGTRTSDLAPINAKLVTYSFSHVVSPGNSFWSVQEMDLITAPAVVNPPINNLFFTIFNLTYSLFVV